MRHFSFLVLLLAGAISWAQQRQVMPSPRIGLGMTATAMRSDLSDTGLAQGRITPGAALSLTFPGKHFAPILQAQIGGAQGQQLQGWADLPDKVYPVQFVETRFTSVSLGLRYQPFTQLRLSPYGAVMAGICIFDPQDIFGNSLINNPLTRLSAEAYTGQTSLLSMGGGLLCRITPMLGVQAEAMYHFTGSDYLDNFSQLGGNLRNDHLVHWMVGMQFALDGRGPAAGIPVPPLPTQTETVAAVGALYYPMRRSDLPAQVAARFGVPLAKTELLTAPNGTRLLRMPNTVWGQGRPPMNADSIRQALDYKAFVYYQVAPGETLKMLAGQTGVSVADLRQLNFLFVSEIEAGDLLRIPDIRAK